jgi:hypothetical protein
LVASHQAKWINGQQVKRAPDESKKSIWAAIESGPEGPTVMQLT